MDRREFIKTADFISAGVLLGVNQIMAESAIDSGRKNKTGEIKNIQLFFADRHRQDCCGCYGNSVVQTPNIDRMARIFYHSQFTILHSDNGS